MQGTVVTLQWTPASGPVVGYQVFVSRNGGAGHDEDLVFANEVTLSGQPGEVIQVAVRAYGFPNGPTQPFDYGEESEYSDPIRFEALPVVSALDPYLDCGSCRRFELRRANGQVWVSFPHPGAGSWELLGVGEMVRGGTEALLREKATGTIYVGELSNLGMRAIGSVLAASFARSTVLPLVDVTGDGLDEVVIHDPATGEVLFWGLDGGEFVQLGSWIGPPNMRLIGAGDLDQDRIADLWYDGHHGMAVVVRMRAFDDVGTSFLAAPLVEATPLHVADYDGDAVPDLFWRDASDGTMSITLVRGHPSAPALETATLEMHPGDAQTLPRESRDVDGTPGAEILLQHANGTLTVAFPNSDSGQRASLLNPGFAWQYVGAFD